MTESFDKLDQFALPDNGIHSDTLWYSGVPWTAEIKTYLASSHIQREREREGERERGRKREGEREREREKE